ncbi:MAG: GNAT family N-acetyltransferase [Dongiaceae bacterium]
MSPPVSGQPIRPPTIRPIAPNDADDVIAMSGEFGAYLRALGDKAPLNFDAKAFREAGFGPRRAFDGIVAHVSRRPAGYLLFHFGYDVDRSLRLLYIIDLWVREEVRRHGVGRALMAEVARIAREFDAGELVWNVYDPNRLAFNFYESLGAERISELTWMSIPVVKL